MGANMSQWKSQKFIRGFRQLLFFIKQTGCETIKRNSITKDKILWVALLVCTITLISGMIMQDQAVAPVSVAAVQPTYHPVTTQPTKVVSEPKPNKIKTIKSYHKYRKAHAVHRYRHRYGYTNGLDCWGMSDRLYGQLTSSGQKARIIQYASSMSPRHRSVQVYSGGKWVNYDYKANGYSKAYYATSNSGKVI